MLASTGAQALRSGLVTSTVLPAVSLGLRRGFFSVQSSIDINNFPPRKTNTLVNIIPQGYEAVIERFGKFKCVKQAGLCFAIPFIDEIRLVDMREITITIDPQVSTTRDNVTVKTGGALYVKGTDAYKLCYGVRRPLIAVVTHAQSAMRTATGSVELDTLFHNRNVLNQKLVDDLREATQNWGLKPERYELTEVTPDVDVSHAMAAQSVAERKRRETILSADAVRQKYELESQGKRQAQINEAQGAKDSMILQAEADRQKMILQAEGIAISLRTIAKELETETGREALSYQLASKYVEAMAQGLSQSSTVFLPKDVGDVPKIMGTGMAILDKFQELSPSKGRKE